MKVILRKDVEHLGNVGELLDVKPGYARNYLVPQNKAIVATSKNLKYFESQRAILQERLAKEQATAEAAAEEIRGVVCTIAGKVSEEDRLYGSVAARDIAEQLKAQGLDVEKKMVLLSEPIKTLGSYIVPIRLHTNVTSEITVKVIPEQETDEQ